MKQKKKEQAITLIALVITIIVLLILAGVTIATLTGENGLLTRATESKDNNKRAEAKERVEVAIQTVRIENSGKIEGIVPEDIVQQLKKEGVNDVTSTSSTFPTTIIMPGEIGVKVDENLTVTEVIDGIGNEGGGEDEFVEVTPESLGKSSSDWVYDATEKVITQYVGADVKTMTEIVIPNTLIIDGKKVQVEKVRAIKDYSNSSEYRNLFSSLLPENGSYLNTDLLLSKITVSKGIKEISGYAFSNLKLENVILPEGLEIIGEGAFAYNSGALNDIKFPTTVKRIEKAAFFNNKLKNDIRLTNQIEYLGELCFGYLDTATGSDGIGLYINAEDKPGCNLVMKGINADAAYCYREVVILADSIISQDDNTFFSVADKLKKVKIKGLEKIPGYGFVGSEKLEEVILLNSDTIKMKRISSDWADKGSQYYGAFKDCYALKKVILPDTVEEIGPRAFSSCYEMTDFTLPKNLIKIETEAFSYCYQFSNFIIPKTVTTIGENAFDYTGENIDSANRKIYCEIQSKPVGWGNLWSTEAETEYPINMIWGYTGT